MLEPLLRAERRFYVEGFGLLLGHPDPAVREAGLKVLDVLLGLAEFKVERPPLRERFPPHRQAAI